MQWHRDPLPAGRDRPMRSSAEAYGSCGRLDRAGQSECWSGTACCPVGRGLWKERIRPARPSSRPARSAGLSSANSAACRACRSWPTRVAVVRPSGVRRRRYRRRLAWSRSRASHARREPAHGALLEPEPVGQVPLRQRAGVGELTEGEHLGDGDANSAVVVHLEETAGLSELLKQPAQVIVGERPAGSILGCVVQLSVLRSSARVVPYNYRRDGACGRSTAPTAAGSGPSTMPTATTAGPTGSFI